MFKESNLFEVMTPGSSFRCHPIKHQQSRGEGDADALQEKFRWTRSRQRPGWNQVWRNSSRKLQEAAGSSAGSDIETETQLAGRE